MSTTPSQHHPRIHLSLSAYESQLAKIKKNSIDCVLTDPPYAISCSTGMDLHYNAVHTDKEAAPEDKVLTRTEDQWMAYTKKNPTVQYSKEQKNNFMQFGTIYGSKYAVQTNYGKWDTTQEEGAVRAFLEQLTQNIYEKLRKGGTCIIFYDLWKITWLKEALEKAKFKQIRFIEWIKTNPQPRNSKINYLTNCREIALLAVKGGKPTFNSKYDDAIYTELSPQVTPVATGENDEATSAASTEDADMQHVERLKDCAGIYSYPLQGGKNRFHPTQKSHALFCRLLEKHTRPDDIVWDPFLGAGTTALACITTNRRCVGTEREAEFFNKMRAIVTREGGEDVLCD